MSEQPLTYDWVAGKPKAVPADKLPPKEYMKGNLHIVDLSKCVDPYTESRRCNLWRFNTGGDVPEMCIRDRRRTYRSSQPDGCWRPWHQSLP